VLRGWRRRLEIALRQAFKKERSLLDGVRNSRKGLL
jgi:hypothetical protein